MPEPSPQFRQNFCNVGVPVRSGEISRSRPHADRIELQLRVRCGAGKQREKLVACATIIHKRFRLRHVFSRRAHGVTKNPLRALRGEFRLVVALLPYDSNSEWGLLLRAVLCLCRACASPIESLGDFRYYTDFMVFISRLALNFGTVTNFLTSIN